MPASVNAAIVFRQLPRADRIDPDRRLVEEDDRRVVKQPPGDVEALAHATGVALDALLLTPGEADELEQLGDPPPLFARGNRVELGEVAQVVERGEPLVETALAAEDVSDPLPDLPGVLDDVVARGPAPSPRSGSAA